MKIERIEPGSGQESAWDYPRPPRLEATTRLLRVEFGGVTVAETRRGWRVLETYHPPVYYFPEADVAMEHLHRAAGGSFCEWKGAARHWNVVAGGRTAIRAAWSYPDPSPSYRRIRDAVAFYAGQMDACWVNDERAQPQPGKFYGGWITADVVGPFKGGPGTTGW